MKNIAYVFALVLALAVVMAAGCVSAKCQVVFAADQFDPYRAGSQATGQSPPQNLDTGQQYNRFPSRMGNSRQQSPPPIHAGMTQEDSPAWVH